MSKVKNNYKFTQEHIDNLLKARVALGNCGAREHIIIDNVIHKRCFNCHLILPLEFYNKNSNKWDSLNMACKECANIKIRKRYKELRQKEEITNGMLPSPNYKNKDWLFEEYFTKFRSTTNLAEEFNITYNTILYWLKKFGFKPRTKSEALSGEHNPMFGKEVLAETRERISKSGLGRIVTSETREKISKGNSGKSKSEEHKEKLSAKALIRYINKENHPMYGKKNSWGKHTPEALRKISESKTGSKHHMWGCTGSLNPMYGLRGPEHPAWVENKKNTFYESIRHLPEYYKWRLDVILRDNLTCQICNKRGHVKAHHLYPFALIICDEQIKTTTDAMNSKNLWDINNGQTLCEDCHRKTNSYAVRLKRLQELYPNNIEHYYSIHCRNISLTYQEPLLLPSIGRVPQDN